MDEGRSVQQTSDGGYIITGSIEPSLGKINVWLIKTDTNGDTLWAKTYGGEKNIHGIAGQPTSDGGYILLGFQFIPWIDGNLWFSKTDSIGDTLWTKTYSRGGASDFGQSIQQTTDGGYIITGETEAYSNGPSDLWLIKTDANGDTLWTKTFGDSGWDGGNSVQQTTDGGYIILGVTSSFATAPGDLWLIKTDSNGDTLWTKTYGGTDIDVGTAIQQTSDGGFIITGYTYSCGSGSSDVWFIKTNTNGDTLWTKTYGGSDVDESTAIQQTSDDGYIITGYTLSFGSGSSDVWLIRTDCNGDTLWTETFGGNGEDFGYSVQ